MSQTRTVPFPFEQAVLVSTPTLESSRVYEQFCGVDLATGPDISATFALMIDDDGYVTGYVRLDDEQPTGHITVDGEPMAVWLPPGVTAESIGVGAVAGGQPKRNQESADAGGHLKRQVKEEG